MKLLKAIIVRVYVIILMVFTVWYGTFMWPLIFEDEPKRTTFSATAEDLSDIDKDELFTQMLDSQQPMSKTDLGFRVINQPFIEGRFHHIGFEMDEDKASTCVRCHGNITHNESKEVRAFLNMHSFFLACETCHSRPAPGAPPWEFRWSNKEDGTIVPNPPLLAKIEEAYLRGEIDELFPVFGNYGAKIAPGRMDSGSFELLHDEEDMEFAERYIRENERLQDEQKSKLSRIIHENVSFRKVKCADCHTSEGGYLPFEQLGYPPSSLHELKDNPVVGMLYKYEEFHMPTF